MKRFESTIRELASLARTQGYLTFQQVFPLLPDEAQGAERVDAVLHLVDQLRVDLVHDPCAPAPEVELPSLAPEEPAAHTTDPIRMYLSQMADIPLLSREEEISLAKKIEITRKLFRRNLLRSFYALEATVKTLERVHSGELPFDRTIKVSLTEKLTKE